MDRSNSFSSSERPRRQYSHEEHHHQQHIEEDEHAYRIHSDDEGVHHHHHELVERRNGSGISVVDSIVQAASICNSLVTEYCGLCTVYIDKQVQYELLGGTAAAATSAAAADTTRKQYTTTLPSSVLDLQHYYFSDMYYCGATGRDQAMRDLSAAASMLFDEDSVVESVSSRC
mmetsp:Transcript_15258/g.24736  ORF Transcript_15258/g.24736 Transcript_15258/m.24736 type:complete len:173 (-) Transcript_15258:195-713(-)